MPAVSYTMTLILGTFCEPICDKSRYGNIFVVRTLDTKPFIN